MILTPGEPVLDLPGAAVAQIVIVQARSPRGKIRRCTTLMRLAEKDMLRADKGAGPAEDLLRAMPTYWCIQADDKVRIWPKPDAPYEAEIMGRNGRPIGGTRKPVAVQPIEAYVAAMGKAQETQERLTAAPQRVERFSLAQEDE